MKKAKKKKKKLKAVLSKYHVIIDMSPISCVSYSLF